MPIKTFPIQAPDLAEANYKGTRNALAEANLQNTAQVMAQRNAMAPVRQQQAEVNLASSELRSDSDKVRYMVDRLKTTTDQPSWTAAKQDLMSKGMSSESLPDAFDPEVRDQIVGKGSERIKTGSYNPRDYTTESWNSFMRSKNPADLKRYETSASERIANNPDLANRVTQTQSQIAGGKAEATEKRKLGVQLDMMPKVRSAIKKAEVEAKARGEAVTKLGRAKAAYPGLQEVVAKLGTLAEIGTYTMAGRAFDMAAKEMGFGATKGATARVKMTAIVNNQVLPLLRETFGAAFTVAEGESLRATLLDVNATPSQKKATLEAFIEQKMRDIETQERELGGMGQPTSQAIPPVNEQGWVLHKDASGNQAYVGPNGEVQEVQ